MTQQDTPVVARIALVKLLYTVDEAAEALSLSRRTFYNLVTQGTVYTVKIGRSRRVPLKALNDFVESLAQAS